jgi:hypothetical protein
VTRSVDVPGVALVALTHVDELHGWILRHTLGDPLRVDVDVGGLTDRAHGVERTVLERRLSAWSQTTGEYH